jgi:hypothetical protein
MSRKVSMRILHIFSGRRSYMMIAFDVRFAPLLMLVYGVADDLVDD